MDVGACDRLLVELLTEVIVEKAVIAFIIKIELAANIFELTLKLRNILLVWLVKRFPLIGHDFSDQPSHHSIALMVWRIIH